MTKLVLLLSIVALGSACGASSGSNDVEPDAAADVAADAVPDAPPADLAADEVAPPPVTPAECVADPACPFPLLNAHRGLCGDEPENTYAAFTECQQHVVPMFEIDLRMTADGHVVLMHDDTVDRTTDGETRFPGRTKVDQLTLAEIQSLVVDDPRCAADPDANPDRCHPATFAGLLARTDAQNVLFLDFKDGDPAAVAADILAADAGARVIFFDSDFARLRAFRAAVPGGLVMPRAEEEDDFAAFLGPENDDLQIRWIHGDPSHAVPAVTDLLRARGVRLYFNLFTLSDVPFAASEALDDPSKKAPWLLKAHNAMEAALAAGGLGFGTEFAHLGAAHWYPNGFGVAP